MLLVSTCTPVVIHRNDTKIVRLCRLMHSIPMQKRNRSKTMIYYYRVTYEGQLVSNKIRAMSEKDAIDQAYMYDALASASAYSGRARRLYKAERV